MRDGGMKLHQLRSAHEVVAQGLNLSRAAERLNASQPGLTRHLQLLERDLGMALFVRNGRRIGGLTAGGRALMPIIGRILRGVDDLARVAQEQAAGIAGEVTVATIRRCGCACCKAAGPRWRPGSAAARPISRSHRPRARPFPTWCSTPATRCTGCC